MDFSNSVIIPRDDFVELETAAYSQTNKSIKDRSLDTVQASVIIVVIGGAFAASAWAWAKANDWYEKKAREKRLLDSESKKDIPR